MVVPTNKKPVDRSAGHLKNTSDAERPTAPGISPTSDSLAERILSQLETLHQKLAEHGPGQQGTMESSAARITEPVLLAALRQDFASLVESIRSELRVGLDELQLIQSELAAAQLQSMQSFGDSFMSAAAETERGGTDLPWLLEQLDDRISETIRRAVQEAIGAGETAPHSDSGTVWKPPGGQPAKQTPTNPPAQSWEEIRKAFLQDDSNENNAKKSAPSTEARPTAASPASLRAITPPPDTPDEPLEIPEPFDPDLIADPKIKECLLARDRLISSLIARLRRGDFNMEMLTTEQLRDMSSQLPDELVTRVNHTLRRMDEHLRLGELELSLERARMSRMNTQIQATRQQLEHNARQLGWTINPDGSLSTASGTPGRTGHSRRWLGKLGFGE